MEQSTVGIFVSKTYILCLLQGLNQYLKVRLQALTMLEFNAIS